MSQTTIKGKGWVWAFVLVSVVLHLATWKWDSTGARAQNQEPAARKGKRLGSIQQTVPTPKRANTVYSIGTLPRYTPPLAEGDGKDLVQLYCTTCHTTSYITMQPPFPSSIWRKEVDKMIHTYGATIPKDTAEKIIAYLARHYSPQTIAQTYATLARTATKTPSHGAKTPSTPKAQPAWMKQAEQLYLQKCMACHQTNGKGLPGAVPPLAGHAQQFSQTPARRAYVIRAIMYGLQGSITVLGKSFAVMMPPQPPTSDAELAMLLNYVTHAWGNRAKQKQPAPLFSSQEIKAQRGLSLTPSQVHNIRKTLGL